MAIPAGIPAGFIDNDNLPTRQAETYDQTNYVNTIPKSYQAHTTANGISAVNQGVAINSGPRSYFENTVNSGVTTKQKILLT